MCEKQWTELQRIDDAWFKLGTTQTLCVECSKREMRKLRDQWKALMGENEEWNNVNVGMK